MELGNLIFGHSRGDFPISRGEGFEEVFETLCEKFNLSYPSGSYAHCTCGYGERYQSWLKNVGYENEHTEKCSLVLPNFYYKPSGLEIRWYKYPFRDSYSNVELNLMDFEMIAQECIDSIK